MCEFKDTLGDCDRASLEMHMEAVIVRTSRPQSSELGGTLGCRDRARLEEYLEAINLTAVVREGGATGAETLFIG